jgi:hypothetical protein
MKKYNLTFDHNHNIKTDDKLIDLRNNYTINLCRFDKNITFSFLKEKDISDENPLKIDFSFLDVSNTEIDFSSFSNLENNKLYFDELLAVPLEYIKINLPIKKRPYHSRRIDDGMKFIDSEYILKFEKLDLPIYFKISTKNGIDFYFTAKKFEILI